MRGNGGAEAPSSNVSVCKWRDADYAAFVADLRVAAAALDEDEEG
jgi:hypothetical protein